MSKLITKETKPKQIKSMILKLLKTLNIWTSSKPVVLLISFMENITRKLEFEKWTKIPNRGQNIILYQLTSLTTKTFTNLAVLT